MDLEKHIAQLLSTDPRIQAVYLLGSAAKGQMRPDSDIDLALLPAAGVNLDLFARNELASSLALFLGREVDIGLLTSRNLVYAYQAVMTGRRIFVRVPSRADEKIATLLGMYGQFNLDRKEVSNAYSAR